MSSPPCPTTLRCLRAAPFWLRALTRKSRPTRTWWKPTSEERMRSDATPLLDVSGLNAWYAESHVLQGIDLQLFAGEVVTLLGRNGAGKSTTLKAIMSLIARRTG